MSTLGFGDLLAPDRWPVLVHVTARLGGLMLIAPLWSLTLPRGVRAAITVAIALALLPVIPATPPSDRVILLPLALALDFLVGLTIGLGAAVIVHGAVLAGEVTSLQMGLSLGPVLFPTPDVPVSGVGQLQSILALLVYASLGGHTALVRGVAESLAVLPPGATAAALPSTAEIARLTGETLAIAVQVAAPVAVTLLLVNVGLGIVNRAVPQFNTMMVAMPVTIGVGLLALAASLPLIGAVLGARVAGLPTLVTRVVGTFTPLATAP